MSRDYLTDFELMILIAVLRVGDDAYGVPIARELEERGRRSVLLGAVYAALDRMEKHGLVSSRIGEPTAQRGGKAKRYFTVTPKGIRAVKSAQRSLTALWTGVAALKGGTL